MTARGVLHVPWREWIASEDLASIDDWSPPPRRWSPRSPKQAIDPGSATRLVLAILDVQPRTSNQLKKMFVKHRRSTRGVGGTLGRLRQQGMVRPNGMRWELTDDGRKLAQKLRSEIAEVSDERGNP